MPITPSRALSQNFLINAQTQKEIVQALSAHKNHTILEIGPGTGALTQHLALMPAHTLWLVEYDKRCVQDLTQHFLDHSHVRISQMDFLQFPWAELPNTPLHIIGSLPYHITSPIILRCLQAPRLEEAVFVIQKEVGLRITAPSNTKAYGRLSILIQLITETEILFDIQPEDFSPIPKVTSCALKIKPKPHSFPPQSLLKLEKLTHICFQTRRKQIQTILKGRFPYYQEALDRLSINPTARPETLCPQILYELAQILM